MATFLLDENKLSGRLRVRSITVGVAVANRGLYRDFISRRGCTQYSTTIAQLRLLCGLKRGS